MKKMYDRVRITELEVGDVFCKEMRLSGREAFEVVAVGKSCINVKSRNTFEEKKMPFSTKGTLIWLRSVTTKKAEV